jgi:ABC-type multidrug transport system ATPase subunit
LNRTPRWHLRQAGLKPGSERETGLLAELGMEEVADIRLDRLPDAVKTKTEFARLFASDAKVLVIDDALGDLNPDARERICRLLLKRKHIGNTIILYTSRMEEALGIADRIAFLMADGVARIVSAEELNRKYGQKSIVVDYQEGGLAHRTRFPWESLTGPELRDFIAGNRILGIETRAMSGEEIFKMETGAELS